LKLEHAWDFSEGLAVIELRGFKGYIDTKGAVVIKCEYEEAEPFLDGLARVVKNEKMGLINADGDSITPYKYDRIGNFSEGLACVLLEGKVGYIDRYGNEVVALTYDGELEELVRFEFKDSKAIVRKGEKFGVIDKTGSQVRGFEFD